VGSLHGMWAVSIYGIDPQKSNDMVIFLNQCLDLEPTLVTKYRYGLALV
jgi:hypothetical protein